MRKLLLLLLGLLLIVLLSYYCFKTKTVAIENHLLSSAEEIYSEKSLEKIIVSVKGEDLNKTRILVLSGVVNSIEEKENAEKIAHNMNGVYAVENNLKIKIDKASITQNPFTNSEPIRSKLKTLEEINNEFITDTVVKDLIPSETLVLRDKHTIPESTPEPIPEATKIMVEKLNAKSCEKKLEDKLANEKIHFEYNKVLIKESSYTLLNELIEIFKECSEDMLYIEGHTDSKGTTTYNQSLSQKRANAIKTYFVKHGIKKENLKALGYGETHPIATNKTEAGKKLNRRIEFKIKGVK